MRQSIHSRTILGIQVIVLLAFLALIILAISGCTPADGSTRIHTKFNTDWRFINHDVIGAHAGDFDDSQWRTLNLPHDWAIEGPFNPDVLFQGGFLPYPGIGWYRKDFDLDATGKRVMLEFDGVMRDGTVWVNGDSVGHWHFGYTSFAFDITPYINPTGRNIVAVRVENKDFSTRWYPGSGIYRNVWLTITDPVHVAHWGTFVSTPSVTADHALVNVETMVENNRDKDVSISLETSILDAAGNLIATQSTKDAVNAGRKTSLVQQLDVENPHRWDIEDPYMYTVVTKVKVRGRVVDEYVTPFGIRTFEFTADKGFFLNGRQLKIKGVNMHHDLGPLGAAVNTRATERQLEILQSMGVNSIRTAHNPPSPEQMDLCDQMGILVMDEAFDEWRKPKNMYNNSYSFFFDEWAERDMRALVLRDRNHPSVILWSTGNEVPELGYGKVSINGEWAFHYDQEGQLVIFKEDDPPFFGKYDGETLSLDVRKREISQLRQAAQVPSLSGTRWEFPGEDGTNVFEFWDDEDGTRNSRMLTDICHELDPTRPVGSGIHLTIRLDKELMETFDVGGFNYWHESIEDVHEEYPETPMLVTESSATLSTRGEYHFPAERIYRRYNHPSMQISSYDLINTGFGALPDLEFKLQDDNPWLAGQYVWSGFDYHGEPDPYEDMWPAHSSYFGIIDMCGFPKDRFYLYQSVWTDEPMIHILPHWNWTGREGETTPVFCYTNCASAELFVNGVSKGLKSEERGEYRLRWDDVVYEPGSIRVVGYDESGEMLVEKEIRTAGKPDMIALSADRTTISADGEDLSFVTVRILDAEENFCPTADNLISFQIDGPGEIIAVGNGDPTSLESYQDSQRSAFHGLCLVVIRSERQPGTIRLTATARGLKETSEVISSI